MNASKSFSPRDFRSILQQSTPKETTDPDIPKAAVLVPLYYTDDRLYVILTLRTNHVEHHKGEISFPGGFWEKQDSTLRDTALRETFEEVGIQTSDVTILGRLDDRVTRTGISITPFVGIIPYPYEFNVFAIEVAELIRIPLEHLLDPRNRTDEGEFFPDGRPIPINSFKFHEHVVFGATAFILDSFLNKAFPD